MSIIAAKSEEDMQHLVFDGQKWNSQVYQEGICASEVMNVEKLTKWMSMQSRLCKGEAVCPTSFVMCRGPAKKLKMKVSGRRNVYGSILGSRRCMWQSGTTPLFAAVFRSSTHTQPNHFVP
eukprot:4666195-Karenia_brevis.AAC.1